LPPPEAPVEFLKFEPIKHPFLMKKGGKMKFSKIEFTKLVNLEQVV